MVDGVRWEMIEGDCLDVMAGMEPESVDAIVTDPPYGIKFMGKDWDHGVPGVAFWRQALRVAKPGAHLLAFGGTRTFHRLTCAIEDAGWEIRDCVMWVYGQGFPKSHDVSKAIDKAAGAERPVIGSKRLGGNACVPTRVKGGTYGVGVGVAPPQDVPITAPATEAAKQWSGWGTALKPAWEPIIIARKPLCGTVAENVQKWGTGALNIDGCRIETGEAVTINTWDDGSKPFGGGAGHPYTSRQVTQGRWPANLIHDGSVEVLALFPESKTTRCNKPSYCAEDGSWGTLQGRRGPRGYNENGSAARFFYCTKADRHDREEGLDGGRNHHPAVKPTALMRYLCRLVTPPGGVVLDPFAGSGSTGKAAMLEGFRFIGIEKEHEYVEIARARIAHAASNG